MHLSRRISRNLKQIWTGRHRAMATLAVAMAATSCFASPPAQPNDGSYRLKLEAFATHAGENAIDLTHCGDGSGRLFVSTQSGQVYAFDRNGESLGVFLDIAAAREEFTRTVGAFNGLMYIAFHPDFAQPGSPGEGRFYTGHQVEPGSTPADYDSKDHGATGNSDVQFVIAEWKVDSQNADRIDPASYRVVLSINFHTHGHNPHALGELAFNPQAAPGEPDYGKLYIAVGDSNSSNSSAQTNLAYVQRLDNPFGKILRIDPLASSSQSYTVPPDNPFTLIGPAEPEDTDTPRTEAYAIGLRDPQSFCFASDLEGNSVMLAFDMGADKVEEVNLIRPGGNYGWDQLEGTEVYEPGRKLIAGPAIPPAVQYSHTFKAGPGEEPTGGLAAVMGGRVVSDPQDPSFQGQILFADLPRGSLFHTNLHTALLAEPQGKQILCRVIHAEYNGKRGTFAQVIGAPRADIRFGTGEDGTLYIISKQTQTIFRTQLRESPLPVPAIPYITPNENFDRPPAQVAAAAGALCCVLGGVFIVGVKTRRRSSMKQD